MLWRVLSLALATAIGVLPMAPPEHVHDVDHDGHHATVAHRHVSSHDRHSLPADDHDDLAHHDGPELGHHGGPDLDHDDGLAPGRPVTSIDDESSVIALVTPIWTVPSLDTPDAPATTVIAWILPPAARTHSGHVDDVERLIHGPPRPFASLRGPPSLPRL